MGRPSKIHPKSQVSSQMFNNNTHNRKISRSCLESKSSDSSISSEELLVKVENIPDSCVQDKVCFDNVYESVENIVKKETLSSHILENKLGNQYLIDNSSRDCCNNVNNCSWENCDDINTFSDRIINSPCSNAIPGVDSAKMPDESSHVGSLDMSRQAFQASVSVSIKSYALMCGKFKGVLFFFYYKSGLIIIWIW